MAIKIPVSAQFDAADLQQGDIGAPGPVEHAFVEGQDAVVAVQQRRRRGRWRQCRGGGFGRDGAEFAQARLKGGLRLGGGEGQHGYGDSERPAQYQKAL